MNVETDYLVVGLGLAGCALCSLLEEKNKNYIVIDGGLPSASAISAGIYNPVVLKKFTPVWQAQQLLTQAKSRWGFTEKLLGLELSENLPIYRKITSPEEAISWKKASGKLELKDFLQSEIIKNTAGDLVAPHGFGKVNQTGRLHVKKLLSAFTSFLKKNNKIQFEQFEYVDLKHSQSGITYKNIRARHLIFCEGYHLKNNPFFNYLPLKGVKGEMITIQAETKSPQAIIKATKFLVPLKKNIFWTGATYDHHFKQTDVTASALQELTAGLKTLLKCSWHVLDQKAAIRPTVKDRRLLVGRHPQHGNLYVLNGLGTRGTLLAPYGAQQLIHNIENATSLNPEIDIRRFAVLAERDLPLF